MIPRSTQSDPRFRPHTSGWLSWIVGAAIVAVVIVAGLRSSEERAVVRLASEARPWWMLVALALQAATYAFQGEIWRVVIRAGGAALGAHAAPSGVFASFMISTLFRIIGVVPSGLGAFEAASVLTLKVVGVPVAVALAATLLFRGLSFWLPMLPGLLFARRATGGTVLGRSGYVAHAGEESRGRTIVRTRTMDLPG